MPDGRTISMTQAHTPHRLRKVEEERDQLQERYEAERAAERTQRFGQPPTRGSSHLPKT